MEQLFIDEEYVKKYTPIGRLVQWTEIEPTAMIVQRSTFQDILGTNFYFYLVDAYVNNTLNVDEDTLLDYIRPALAYRTAEKTLPFINYQIKNKGVVSQRGDYSDPAELEVIRYLRTELTGSADFHEKRLIEYLCVNSRLFPEYHRNNNDYMIPTKKSDRYDSGLAFY